MNNVLTAARVKEITYRYPRMCAVVAGDFCLDRYFEIDPARQETSLETGLPAHQVVNVRSQPGGAGCVMGNVAAAGTGKPLAVSFCGEDGEGMELRRGLEQMRVDTQYFLATAQRHTFTYGKPLVMRPGQPPEELSRLDMKNWTATPDEVVETIIANLTEAVEQADAVILMEQVDHRNTGVLTTKVKAAAARLADQWPNKVFVADSRCAVDEYSRVSLKINRSELMRHFARREGDSAPEALVAELTAKWAWQLRRNVIITLGGEGILASDAEGTIFRAPKIAVEPPIDIVGAGDCILANVTLALAAGAKLEEAIKLANLAGAVVVKKLGTTGTASPEEILQVLEQRCAGRY